MKLGWSDGLKEGKKLGEQNKAIKMAKTMKKEGEPLEKIERYTGLSKAEIEKL